MRNGTCECHAVFFRKYIHDLIINHLSNTDVFFTPRTQSMSNSAHARLTC